MTPTWEIAGVLRHYAPAEEAALPLIVDSPHSGSIYPDDFDYACDLALLRHAEDAFVDRLFASAPVVGAHLLCADFPRAYIDPNREEDDLDPAFLQPGHDLSPRATARARRGVGLIRRFVMGNEAIYREPLSGTAVRRRLEHYHRPYHRRLAALVDAAAERHGAVWFINAHSMKAESPRSAVDGVGRRRPDINLGDRKGSSCDAAFTAFAAEFFRSEGLSVALNVPYQGATLVQRHGDPARGRHALQIEINRGLYLDEARLEPAESFDDLVRLIERFLDATAEFVRAGMSSEALASS